MLKVIFYPALTLDGFIATEDGDSSWVTDEDERLFADEVQAAGCVIVGRKTFEQFKGVIYPVANATTFVCTTDAHSLKKPPSDGIHYVSGDVANILQIINAQGFMHAVLSGGAQTNACFAAAGAIDEVIASIYPKFLGIGMPLFGSQQINMQLDLLETRQLQGGVVRNRYRVKP